MARTDLLMPKMGESIMEATILKWVKNVGDKVEEDETILEIATDKVDSEIPSPVDGVIKEILFKEDDIVEVGKVIAIIETEGEESETIPSAAAEIEKEIEAIQAEVNETPEPVREASPAISVPTPAAAKSNGKGSRFYSPLVKSIAAKENISIAELDNMPGSGAKGRVTKKDILSYVKNRGTITVQQTAPVSAPVEATTIIASKAAKGNQSGTSIDSSGTEIIEMDRMRKLIADHMVMSKHTSPHVTSFVEADVTNIVNWRNANKNLFVEKYGEKITYTPIFIEAVVKAIKDFPMINISLDGDRILKKKDINVGMAAALPSGNLIVPVIKNADYLNLPGLTRAVNDLAGRARANKLKPEEIQGGTFTITNVGTFGNVMGTPIINQPQVAILATGAIRKKPAVVETEFGDVIAIRQMMYLSLSYDHRIVDGFLGGSYLRKVADYLEQFDHTQTV
ncbi:MAG: 2-oxo acid dehydrogenase subunit E2 [Bacteroidia bacterium]|nr:2-oxo acid dehydrogenase subunit E2 [Bacteroidia bacterium]